MLTLALMRAISRINQCLILAFVKVYMTLDIRVTMVLCVSAFVATIGTLEKCTELYETWYEYYTICQHNVIFSNFLQFVLRI
jgi:hypothetical protein